MDDFMNMFSSTLDLREIFQELPDLPNDVMLEHQKKLNQLISNAKRNAKGEKCLYCDEEVKSFCNSHTIPAFILNNISSKGNLYNANKMIGMPLLKEEDGINRSGTFHVICRECDSKVFAEYENPESYNVEPSHKMLAQIAMKNYLKNIYKRKLELEMYKVTQEQFGLPKGMLSVQNEVNKLDSDEFMDGYLRAKKAALKNSNDTYYMFFCQRLEYVVPVAFQGPIAMISDLEGNEINNFFNMDPKYKLQELHLCIFPFESHSLVFMFIDSKSKRYRNFYKQFKKLNLEEQLKVVVYLLFAYTEDFFVHKYLDKKALENETLLNISGKSTIVQSMFPFADGKSSVKQSYNFAQVSLVPNILGEKYQVLRD